MAKEPQRKRTRIDRAAQRGAARSGVAPGAGSYVGEPRDHRIRVSVFDYATDHVSEADDASVTDLQRLRDAPTVTWVNLDGVHDADAVAAVCQVFGLHPLAIEDVLNPSCRPKTEDYGDHIFCIAKMLVPDASRGSFEVEQVSVVLGPTWVLTLQERQGDLFDSVRRRLRTGSGRIRSQGADYLLHAILDAIVDGWFAVLEQSDTQVTELEAIAAAEPDADLPRMVHGRIADLLALRRLLWPTREAVVELSRSEGVLLKPATLPYLRDLLDHVVEALDILTSQRERLTAALELHLAVTSNRMNEVMRLLTIVATLFIPVTFIAGVYGMNFDHMPELHWPWAYPVAMVSMAAIMAAMVAWLRHKRWL